MRLIKRLVRVLQPCIAKISTGSPAIALAYMSFWRRCIIQRTSNSDLDFSNEDEAIGLEEEGALVLLSTREVALFGLFE